MTRYKLDDQDFPKDPVSKRWTRQQVAQGGTGKSIYSAFWQVELGLPILENSDISFFETRWLAGGLHNVTLAHPVSGAMVRFTGTNVADFTYEYMDVDNDSYGQGGRLVINHVNLSATGSV